MGAIGLCDEQPEGTPPPKAPAVSPLVREGEPVRAPRPAALLYSDGTSKKGDVWLTPGVHRLTLFDVTSERNREFEFARVVRIDIEPEREEAERVWRWKENASDEKVYSGASYPWRLFRTVLTVRGARGKSMTATGHLDALLYYQGDPKKKPEKIFLHRRHKLDPGRTLADQVYVTAVVFEQQKGQAQ